MTKEEEKELNKEEPPIKDKEPVVEDELIAEEPEEEPGFELDEEEEIPEEEPPDKDKDLTLKNLMVKKGFKDETELVKSFLEQEQTITKQGQEKQLGSFIPPVELPVTEVVEEEEPEIKLPTDLYSLIDDKEALLKFSKSLISTAEGRAVTRIRKENADKEYKQLYSRAMAKINENPKEFHRRRGTMQNLSNTPQFKDNADFNQLYDVAGTIVDQQENDLMDLVKKKLGLENVDLQAMAGKRRPASISSSPGGGHTGVTSISSPEGKVKKIIDDILAADKIPE